MKCINQLAKYRTQTRYVLVFFLAVLYLATSLVSAAIAQSSPTDVSAQYIIFGQIKMLDQTNGWAIGLPFTNNADHI
jgi:hypothetical protein